MNANDLRAARAEFRQTPWAVRPETLATITALLRGHVSAEEARERVGRQGPEAEAEAAERAAAAQQAAMRTGSIAGAVAVISLRGLITPRGSFLSMLFGGGGGLQAFRRNLRDALSNDDIASILIDIDSPGGSTDLVAETANEIRSARGTKPIVAIANTWAASAAYWLGSQADELVVTPSGEVGSIGVFCIHEDWSKWNEEFGINVTYIKAGKFKTEGNPDEPLTEEAEAAIQAKVDEFYGMFVADVAKGRGATASAVRAGYGEGRMVTAKQAVALGMADRVDTYEGTVEKLVRGKARSRSAEAPPAGPDAAETPEAEEDGIAADAITADAITAAEIKANVITVPPSAEADDDDDPAADADETGDDEAPSAALSAEDARALADVLFD